MYPWVTIFIVGWFGTLWWPGMWVDAPPRGPNPEPWWTRWALGVIGGIVAVAVSRFTAASSDPMPGLVLALAAGRVGSAIFEPAFRLLQR
jgi:hypothetical protein